MLLYDYQTPLMTNKTFTFQVRFLIGLAIALAFSSFTSFIAILENQELIILTFPYKQYPHVFPHVLACFSGQKGRFIVSYSRGRRPLPAYPTPGLRSPLLRCQTLGAFVGQNGRTVLEGPSSFLLRFSLLGSSTLGKNGIWKIVCDA